MVKWLLPKGTTDWVVIAVMAAIALVIGAWVLLPSSDSGGESRALVACKQAVKAQLAHPATADFKITATSISETSDGYQVTGSLTGENGFGVPSEFGYSCETTGTAVTSAVLTPR